MQLVAATFIRLIGNGQVPQAVKGVVLLGAVSLVAVLVLPSTRIGRMATASGQYPRESIVNTGLFVTVPAAHM